MRRDDLPEWAQDMPRGVLMGALSIDPTPPMHVPSLPMSPHLLIDPWLAPEAWVAAMESERWEKAS